MPHQVRSHTRHRDDLTRLALGKVRAPEPSLQLEAKIHRFKDIYGPPAYSIEDVFFESIKETYLVRVGGMAPSDERIRKVASELAEEFEEEMGEFMTELTRKYPPIEHDSELLRKMERWRQEAAQFMPVELEVWLDGLERALERKRTETGRRQEIENTKTKIRQYEEAIGRRI